MAKTPIISKGLYRHNKTGNLYEVIGVALQTESDETLVVYRPQAKADYELFARPCHMFVELVEINGQMVPRFEPVDVPRSFIV